MSAAAPMILHPPGAEVRLVTLCGDGPEGRVQWRKSGAGGGQLTVAGHAAVFNRLSLELADWAGLFRERIREGAFDRVLDATPDVWLLWDHSTLRVLARTRNKTLDLRSDPVGLHFWGRVAGVSYATDLQVLMERGDIDQASFAFDVNPERGGKDEWTIDANGMVTRDIIEVSDLYDVTVTAMGAYPQTDSGVVRQLRSRLTREVDAGRLPEEALASVPDLAATQRGADAPDPEDPQDPGDPQRDTDPSLLGGPEGEDAPDEQAVAEARKQRIELLRARAEADVAEEQERKRELFRRKHRLS